MIIGTCSLKLMIYESNSLKDKRRVLKSIIERIKSRFNVSIAEVDLNEKWQLGAIGIACVTAYMFSGHTGIYTSQIIGSPKHIIFWKKKKGKMLD